MPLDPVDDYRSFLKSKEWERLKTRFIYENHTAKCFVCGWRGNLVLHHLGYIDFKAGNLFHHFFIFNWGNLMIVCRDCHDRIHFGLFKRKTKLTRRKLLKRAYFLRSSRCLRNLEVLRFIYYCTLSFLT